MKIAMLRLRNRTLNRFKKLNVETPVVIKKTLRVVAKKTKPIVRFSAPSTAPMSPQKPTSPLSKLLAEIGIKHLSARLVTALKNTHKNRFVLRSKRAKCSPVFAF